jgi:hypothetical protein
MLGNALDRERFDYMSRDDQHKDQERSYNSFASHIELHRFERRIEPFNRGSPPLPPKLSSHRNVKRL